MLENYNTNEIKHKYTFSRWKWATMPLALGAPLNGMEALAPGAMEEREGQWLERKMVSRHSHGHHNDRERRNVLRVTPTPLFIHFLRDLGF